jgi:sulfate adenylyltransferase
VGVLIAPHGSLSLKPLLVNAEERGEPFARASGLPAIPLSTRELSDLYMLGMGAYTPLTGFMGEADWRGCCRDMTLSDGLFWPIPITVSCDVGTVQNIKLGQDVALFDPVAGEVVGQLTVEEIYSIDKNFECEHVFLTTDPAHPGVRKVLDQGEFNLAGPVKVFSEGHFPRTYAGLYLRPNETRALFESNGWSTVAAFQTRNPMHRSHEYLAKIAIEICDGILIHQVLGALKPGDIPAETRVDAINALVSRYFVPKTAVQAGYPIEMRYGGPREALFHALFRQNFGCTHLVVGRDHAGVGNYYGPLDAHKIFDQIPADSLKIRALKIDVTFYCYACEGMATGRTCPHEESSRLAISGTRLREMFANREPIPNQYSRPEVVQVLQQYYDGLT